VTLQSPPAEQERTLIVVAGTVVAICLLVWAAGQTAVFLHSGVWMRVPVQEAPFIVWRVATNPADPQAAWPPEATGLLLRPTVFYVILVGLVAAATTLVGVVGWWWTQRRGNRKGEDAVTWAKPKDLKAILVPHPKPGRLTLGRVGRRLVATEAQHSVIVLGPSGTRKTTGFAIPALLEWDGPVVATTVKGDLVEHTAHRRRRKGEVWVFDPTASTGQPSAGWNPLSVCQDWQGALRMAAWLVATARAGDRGGLQDSDFWYAVAQKLLAPLLLAASLDGQGMRDVVRWVDLQEAEEPAIILEEHDEEDAVEAFAATLLREERSRSGAYTTAETVLAAYSDPGVLATTRTDPRITSEQLLDGGSHTVYVCAPSDEQQRLRPIFTALIEQIVHAVYARANHPDTRLKKPLLLVIDEAANIAPLPNLAQLASTARGVGIQLVTAWQDFAQIQAMYTTFSATVINNHRAKVVLPGVSDPPTLDYFAKIIGEEAVAEVSETHDQTGSIRTRTEATRRRPLASPVTLRQADTGTGFLVYGNLPPARLKLRSHHPRVPRRNHD
jgi:type IV secretion system protein VirD4